MYRRIVQFIEKFHMIGKEDSVILGISGGADSVCLFFVLLQYMKDLHGDEYGKYLRGIHVHHGIRGAEADGDMEFVQKLLEGEGVTCQIRKCDVPMYAKEKHITLEEAGRILRYKIFRRAAEEVLENRSRGRVRIAVAHNENDNAETILHNLCRGSSLKGLQGILPVNDDVIRPLLCVKRNEIENFLKERGIFYQTDGTNLETSYTRNRIRLLALPMLEEQVNEQAISHIADVGNDVRAAEQFLEKITKKEYEKIVSGDTTTIIMSIPALKELDEYLAKRVLRRGIEQMNGGLKDVTRTHVEQLYQLLDKQSGKSIQLPNQIKASISFGKLILQKEKSNIAETSMQEEVEIVEPGIYIFGEKPVKFQVSEYFLQNEEEIINFLEKNIKNGENFYTKFFDYDKMEFTLRLRYRKSGDILAIDSTLRHKKLKSFFIDEKIPQEQRGKIPLLADGSHILWIVGYRISERYKVTRTTRHVLKVTVTCSDIDY